MLLSFKTKIPAVGQLLAETSFELPRRVQLRGGRPSFDSLPPAISFPWWFPSAPILRMHTGSESRHQLEKLLTAPLHFQALHSWCNLWPYKGSLFRIHTLSIFVETSATQIRRLWHYNKKKPQTWAASSLLLLVCFSHHAFLARTTCISSQAALTDTQQQKAHITAHWNFGVLL